MVFSRKKGFVTVGIIITAVYCVLMTCVLASKVDKGKLDDRAALEKALYELYTSEPGRSASKIAVPAKKQYALPGLGACREFAAGLVDKNNNRFNMHLAGLPDSVARNADIVLMKKIVDDTSLASFDSLLLFPENLSFPVNLYPYYRSFVAHCDTSFLSNTALFDAVKRTAILYHDREYIIIADSLFILLEKIFRCKDPEVRAWHGSVTTKFALTASSPVDKVDFVNNGVKMIDGSLAESPKNLTIRYIRYFNYLALPSFFKKRAIIMNDIRFLDTAFKEGRRMEFVDRCLVRDSVIAKEKFIEAIKTGIASPNLLSGDKTELRRLLVGINGGKQ